MLKYDPKAGVVDMYGVVGDELTGQDFREALNAMGGKPVTINLQSPGGDVLEGFSMANAISAYPGAVTVAIDALAASIASVFMMRADLITANENATVMIHNAWTIAVGNANDFRMTADLLDDLDGRIANEYARKSGRPADDFREYMNAETHFTAQAAAEVGLVDIVLDVEKREKAQFKPVATLCPGLSVDAINALFQETTAEKIPRPRLARARAMLARMELGR